MGRYSVPYTYLYSTNKIILWKSWLNPVLRWYKNNASAWEIDNSFVIEHNKKSVNYSSSYLYTLQTWCTHHQNNIISPIFFENIFFKSIRVKNLSAFCRTCLKLLSIQSRSANHIILYNCNNNEGTMFPNKFKLLTDRWIILLLCCAISA